MNNQSIIRYGGIAAIVSALLFIVSAALWMTADPAAAPPPLSNAVYIISSLVFLVTLAALYFIHRSESSGLSLIAVLLVALGTVASFFTDPSDMSDPLTMVVAAIYSVGILLLGWLAYRSPQMPRGMGLLVLLMGVLALAGLALSVAGATDAAATLNGLSILPFVVWMVWLGWHLLKFKADAPQTA